MGKLSLVATWLRGIGLHEAVPTFEAAGIVSPSALAELDVTHFEALGISDADDRRKLFYLVQRIKMAVNKDNKEKSVEAQVDAVISGIVVDDSAAVADDGDDDDGAEEEKKQSNDEDLIDETNITQQKQAPKPAPKPAPSAVGPRRSKRLAEVAARHPVEKNSSKENTTVNGSVKKNSPTSLFASKSKKKAERGRPTSDRKISTRSKDTDNHIGATKSEATPNSNAKTIDGTANPNRKTKANAVFGLDDDGGEEEEITRNAATTKTEKKSGLRKPQYASSASSAFSDDTDSLSDLSETNSFQTPSKPKAQPPTTRRPESRLQNPGKSIRTGKQLSSIPSEAAAPMSPLVDLPVSKLEETSTRQKEAKTSRRLSGGHKRRTSNDSLDELLQSSASSFESGSDSAGAGSGTESLSSLPSLKKKRSKSIGSTDRGRTNSNSSAQATPRSAKIVRRRGRGVGGGKTRTADLNDSFDAYPARSDSSVKSSESSLNTSFTHGGNESESFATKISHLRQDNQEEHELFCDGADQELYHYDMRIRVIVRKRPVSKSEASVSGGIDVIHPLDYGDYGRILVYQPKTRVDLTKEVETIPFAYDNIFGEDSTNIQIYRRSLRSLILPFFKGQWATVFAYGQTGSGKTYTMMGSNMTGVNAGTATNDDANLGLYYLAALDIFDMLQREEYKHLSVQVSLFEIYGGKLFDLLNKRKQIKCLEDSRGKVCFPGLTEHPVNGPNRLMDLIEKGALNRSTGTTSRNADSSRSHAVLQLRLRKDVGRRKNIEHGRLNFIDLAGSERGADTSSCSRATRLEGAEINTSLLALKEVIRALATGGSMAHIPFRGSKLTQVLKDSFVGENSRCCMIACISPDIRNCEQTLNTLRYADRVKERNAETGAMSSSYEQPVRLGPIDLGASQRSSVESSTPESDEELSDRDYFQDIDNGPAADEGGKSNHSDTDNTAVLDDLLANSLNEQSMSEINSEFVSTATTAAASTSTKHRAGEALVASHRSVMSSMLAMVKTEMSMVNRVDADRDRLDDYLQDLETIQATQLDLISKLRTSLNNYVSAAEDNNNEADVVNATRVESDDESFEDLRD